MSSEAREQSQGATDSASPKAHTSTPWTESSESHLPQSSGIAGNCAFEIAPENDSGIETSQNSTISKSLAAAGPYSAEQPRTLANEVGAFLVGIPDHLKVLAVFSALGLVNILLVDLWLFFGIEDGSSANRLASAAELFFAAYTAAISLTFIHSQWSRLVSTLASGQIPVELLDVISAGLVCVLSVWSAVNPELGFGFEQPGLIVISALVMRGCISAASSASLEQLTALSTHRAKPGAGIGESARDVDLIVSLKTGATIGLKAGEVAPIDLEIVSGVCEVLERPAGGFYVRAVRSTGDLLLRDSVILRVRPAAPSSDGSDVESSQPQATPALMCKLSESGGDSRIDMFDEELDRRLVAARADISKGSKPETLLVVGLLIAAVFASFAWSASAATPSQIAQIILSVMLVTLFADFLRLKAFLVPVCIKLAYGVGALIKSEDAIAKISGSSSIAVRCSEGERGVMNSIFSRPRISRLEMLDERVGEESVRGVLYAVGSAVLAQVSKSFELHTNHESAPLNLGSFAALWDQNLGDKELPLVGVEAFQTFYSDEADSDAGVSENRRALGVLAIVDGVRIAVGCEDFLIENGVQLQPSDLEYGETLKSTDQIWLLAIGREVVSRFVIEEGLFKDFESFASEMKERSVRVILVGSAPQSELDGFGKGLGLELSQIKGGVSGKRWDEFVLDRSDMALLLDHPLAIEQSQLDSRNVTQLIRFNRLRWELDRGDCVLFDSRLSALVSLWEIVRVATSFGRTAIWYVSALSLLLIGLSVSAFIPPWITAAAVLFGTVAINLYYHLVVSRGWAVSS